MRRFETSPELVAQVPERSEPWKNIREGGGTCGLVGLPLPQRGYLRARPPQSELRQRLAKLDITMALRRTSSRPQFDQDEKRSGGASTPPPRREEGAEGPSNAGSMRLAHPAALAQLSASTPAESRGPVPDGAGCRFRGEAHPAPRLPCVRRGPEAMTSVDHLATKIWRNHAIF